MVQSAALTEQRSLVRPDSYRDQYVKSYIEMASVYILYSPSLKRYYIGSCKDIDSRISDHLTKYFSSAYTAKVSDWIIFFKIDNLNYSQARKIEQHIKKMKSQTYISNLNKYPELVEKIINKFA